MENVSPSSIRMLIFSLIPSDQTIKTTWTQFFNMIKVLYKCIPSLWRHFVTYQICYLYQEVAFFFFLNKINKWHCSCFGCPDTLPDYVTHEYRCFFQTNKLKTCVRHFMVCYCHIFHCNLLICLFKIIHGLVINWVYFVIQLFAIIFPP